MPQQRMVAATLPWKANPERFPGLSCSEDVADAALSSSIAPEAVAIPINHRHIDGTKSSSIVSAVADSASLRSSVCDDADSSFHH